MKKKLSYIDIASLKMSKNASCIVKSATTLHVDSESQLLLPRAGWARWDTVFLFLFLLFLDHGSNGFLLVKYV